jgi:hypothetical protein
MEEARHGADLLGTFLSVLTLQGKCLLFRAKAAHSSEHLLADTEVIGKFGQSSTKSNRMIDILAQ